MCIYIYIFTTLYTHRYHTISDDLYHCSIFVDGYAKIQPNTPAARCFLAEAAAVLSTRDVPNSQWLVDIPGLVNSHITMERSTIFHG